MKPEVICFDHEGRPVLYLPLSDSTDSTAGEVIRLNRRGDSFASADIARLRLKEIIRADREAVPCGRWVYQFNRIGVPTPSLGRNRYRYVRRK